MKDSICVMMADSVRSDKFPEFEEGITVDAVAAGKNTPLSFTAMLTGLGPEHHGVTWFDDVIEEPTVLNLDQMGMETAYYDHPDSPMYRVLNHRNRKRFSELDKEEDFVWVKRDTASHFPYGESWEDDDRELEEDASQLSRASEEAELLNIIGAVRSGALDEKDVIEKGAEFTNGQRRLSQWQKNRLVQGIDAVEEEIEQKYEEGIEKTKQSFLDIIEQAKEEGVYEDTLFVYCTDHGDAHPRDERFSIGHGDPLPSVTEIKAHFINADEETVERFTKFGEMSVKDIIKVWKPNWDMLRGTLEVKNSRKPDETSEEKIEQELERLGYK